MTTQILFGAVLFLIFGICIFLAWYFTHRARHKERLLMIEKGMNPYAHEHGGSALLKVGIVIIGLSIGLASIGVLAHFHSLGDPNATPLSILGMSGGIALLVANSLSKSKN